MTAEALALRRRIMTTFAATGAPPEVRDDAALRELEAARVVVVARGGGIGSRPHGPSLRGPPRGHAGRRRRPVVVGQLRLGRPRDRRRPGLPEATLAGGGVALAVRGGAVAGDAVFHVAVPAGRWWEDIGFT